MKAKKPLSSVCKRQCMRRQKERIHSVHQGPMLMYLIHSGRSPLRARLGFALVTSICLPGSPFQAPGG